MLLAAKSITTAFVLICLMPYILLRLAMNHVANYDLQLIFMNNNVLISPGKVRN